VKKSKTFTFLNKNRILIQAGLTLIFLLLTLFLSLIFQNKIGSSIINTKIQGVVSEKESQLTKSIQQIEQEVKKGGGTYFHLTNSEISKYNSENLYFYVFNDDSLIAWSNNEVIPNLDLLNSNNSSKIIKLKNGYYLGIKHSYGNNSIIGIFPIEHRYQIVNEYLQNQINTAFGVNNKIWFSYEQNKSNHHILNKQSHYLFSVNYEHNPILNNILSIILFLVYFLTIVFLFNYLYVLFRRKISKKWFLPTYIISLLFIRIILQYIQLPESLYNTDIYSPTSFAISNILPSLGDLFLSVYTVFIIVLSISRNLDSIQAKQYSKPLSIGFSIGLILFTYLAYSTGLYLIQNLILNSNISFSISNLFSLNHLSFIGLSIITGVLFIIILVIILSAKTIHSFVENKKEIVISLLVSFAIISISNILVKNIPANLFILYWILLIIIGINSKSKSYYNLGSIVPILLVLSFISAISLNQNVHIAEQNRRKSIVRSVATNEDPQVEYQFKQVEQQIYQDSVLIQNFHNNDISFDSINSYIQLKYFSNHALWSKYDLQFTICDQEQELVIKPDNLHILCKDFFYNNLIAYGKLTNNKNLYHLKYGTGQINYLGLFRFYEKTQKALITYTVYLEINSKLKRKGFTKLLSEKGNDPFEKLKGYSLAAYYKGKLVENYGTYSYPENLNKALTLSKNLSYFDKKDFNHLYYKSNKEESYILSKKNPENLAKIAPFSYLFILFSVLFILFSLLLNNSIIQWELEANFTTRLQLSMIAIIVVSFTIISYFSAHYIVSLNNEKNNQRLKNLSTSLQMEFEHKVRNIDVSKEVENKDYLQSLSVKFSKVFDTDINLYSLGGNLLSSTRPEIFDKNLLSQKINPIAYNKLAIENESFIITEENIGKLKYSSAYLPFHNSNKEVVAYLNLPYFARQNELQSEISSFLMTIMNVYTFIIVLSIIVILFMSNYISRPLRMIKEKMQKLTLGGSNEKIEWSGEDEIGHLIVEYNLMVEQLSQKAELLAKSERESAWREMAKQVAHEIKNPLTPMKLSVQYLLRSWNEKDPDWEDRLHRLSDTLIQQIDTLSDIATAFSDFAKMPKSNNEKIELNETISHAIELYKDYDNIQINFTADENKTYNIFADQKQLLRVFNNLIKNSIQSFEINKNGFVDIDIVEQSQQYIIHFRDNGCGIPKEQQAMIFVPNFTTKSKGTGLGLAMVKNIILNLGGDITFESEEGKGTVFTIVLPKYESINNGEIS